MDKIYRLVKDGMDMSYCVLIPDNYDKKKKYPLIVTLHGAGTYGTTPEEAFLGSVSYNAFYKHKPEAVVMYPHSPYATWSSQLRNLKFLIDTVCEKFNIDMDRVSIAGGSMGGYGTWDMITEYPDFFAAAAPICGGGKAWAAERIKNMPIWIYHGDSDLTVLPERSDEMYKRLKALNPDNKELHYTLIPNTGHNAWDKAYLEDNVYGWLISHKKKKYDVYVGSQTADGGIYRYKLDDGKLVFAEKYPEAGVSYLIKHRGKMYATVNQTETKIGGVVRYDMDRERLVNRSALMDSKGCACCHIVVDSSSNAYVVNYLTGNVVKLNMTSGVSEAVLHIGEGVSKPRQDKAHTHQICFTPDDKYFTVCDLGTDTIHVYDFDLIEVSRVSAVPGSGPRHIIFSDDGKYAYCVNELDNTVTAYEYAEGKLTKLDSYNMLPPSYDGLTTAAAIRINGKYLYASTRGHDSVTRFEIDGGKLTYVDNTSVHGKRPRDINITPDGKYMLCANEGSNTVTMFEIKQDGSLEFTGNEYEVPGALCVIFA